MGEIVGVHQLDDRATQPVVRVPAEALLADLVGVAQGERSVDHQHHVGQHLDERAEVEWAFSGVVSSGCA